MYSVEFHKLSSSVLTFLSVFSSEIYDSQTALKSCFIVYHYTNTTGLTTEKLTNAVVDSSTTTGNLNELKFGKYDSFVIVKDRIDTSGAIFTTYKRIFSETELILIKSIFLDINECSAQSCNPCHQLAACSNLPGTYACGCQDGFQGDGVISCRGWVIFINIYIYM